MAFTLFMSVPELKLERYDAMIVELGLDANPPAGLILHVASEGVDAINVLELWQTQLAAESFVERRLRDALESQGLKDPPAYRIEPLHNLFVPEMDMVERIGATSLPGGFPRRSVTS